MATLLEVLLDTINEEIKIYDELLAIGKEKKNIIIKNQVEVLKQMNTVEISLTNKLKKLSKKRLESFEDIKMVLGLTGQATLSNIAQKLKDEKEKTELLKARDKLKEISIELGEVNQINRNLIGNSLDYIDFSINLIRQTSSDETGTYSKDDLKRK